LVLGNKGGLPDKRNKKSKKKNNLILFSVIRHTVPRTRTVDITFLLCPHQDVPTVVHSILGTSEEYQQTEKEHYRVI